MKVLLAILAAAGNAINAYNVLAAVATTTAEARDSWAFVGADLSDVHRITTTNADAAGNTSAAPLPESRTAPSITSFSATPQTTFYIGDDKYEVQGAGKSYSLTNPDPKTLRFEVRPGDKAWYDYSDGAAVDRDDVALDPTIPAGTPININYQFMVEPNGTNGSFRNSASWFTTAEMNGYPAVSSPPFEIGLVGNQLHVMARYCPPGQAPKGSNMTQMILWTASNPIQPGEYNDIKISANVSDDRSGYLEVWVNGSQVVSYHGPLGYGTPTYLEYGLYRNAGPSETVAARFRNMTLTTGPGLAGGGALPQHP